MRLRRLGNNETQITFADGWDVLFSYSTPVAAQSPEGDWFRTEYKHSVTTSRHINQWLNGTHAELRPQSFFNDMVLGV
tara:strand:- start:826 stop:1059 length:234 start_codon:yes stop_codon:yes gene_type:complete